MFEAYLSRNSSKVILSRSSVCREDIGTLYKVRKNWSLENPRGGVRLSMSSFTGVIMSFILCRPGGSLPKSKYTFGSTV